MKKITLAEAKKIIRKYGIDEGNYVSANIKYSMVGGDPTDNSLELTAYYRACLRKVANRGLRY